MSKKIVFFLAALFILFVASGCSIIHTITGNVGEMEEYLVDTAEITNEYNHLKDKVEQLIETNVPADTVTETVIIPTLERLISQSQEYGENISNEELKEIHQLYTQTYEVELHAEKEWLIDLDDHTYNERIIEVVQMDEDYRNKIEELGKKWGMEIDWDLL
ncbi:hypothetical protein [Alkalihalobacterium bogoriense]|uniref:hypothetical protein n=1 Tax=Alkalihalobacterium bogoriense TaxID=246272 RepID=UPI00047B14DC|nr:hypothetical protein [Alkalihalobacterium bogoriense]